MVTALAIMAVIALLLVVVLAAGQSAYTNSEKGSRWTKTLGVAEVGVNDAITQIASNRSVVPTCQIGTGSVCSTTGGEYQWEQTKLSGGRVLVQSIGYFPQKTNAEFSSEIQVLLEPVPTFQYALFSQSTLSIKNGAVVSGDIYSKDAVDVGTSAIICGSIVNSQGGVNLQNNSEVLKSYSTCSGKSGKVWAGGTITTNNGVTIEGDATASAPSSVTCPPSPNTQYAILGGGTVQGTATACGTITAVAPTKVPNTRTDPPAVQSLPTFTFDPANYPGMHCYAINTTTCSYAASNWSSAAVTSFNSVSKSNMQGTYVIWQSNPGPSKGGTPCQNGKVCLNGLSLSGDLTIITNAPIDLGNTSTVTSSVPASLTIISLYVPPAGTDCSTNNTDYCSIYAKNSVTFAQGDPSNPDDGIAVLLYTPGKMSFKNTGGNNSTGDGSLYAGSMDIKNGFDITYNARVERVLGFGQGLEQTVWQEIT